MASLNKRIKNVSNPIKNTDSFNKTILSMKESLAVSYFEGCALLRLHSLTPCHQGIKTTINSGMKHVTFFMSDTLNHSPD